MPTFLRSILLIPANPPPPHTHTHTHTHTRARARVLTHPLIFTPHFSWHKWLHSPRQCCLLSYLSFPGPNCPFWRRETIAPSKTTLTTKGTKTMHRHRSKERSRMARRSLKERTRRKEKSFKMWHNGERCWRGTVKRWETFRRKLCAGGWRTAMGVWGGGGGEGGQRHKSSIEQDADKARNVFFSCHGCEQTMKNKHALSRCLRLNAFSSCNCHLDLSRINLYFPLSDTQCRHVPPCTRLAVHTQLAVYYGTIIKRPCNIAPPPPQPIFSSATEYRCSCVCWGMTRTRLYSS